MNTMTREQQADHDLSLRLANREWAVEKPYVVHYRQIRKQPEGPPQDKSEMERFATEAEAEDAAERLVRAGLYPAIWREELIQPAPMADE